MLGNHLIQLFPILFHQKPYIVQYGGRMNAEEKIHYLLSLLPQSIREEIKEYIEKRDIESLTRYVVEKFNIPRSFFEDIVKKLESRLEKDKNKVEEIINRIMVKGEI